MIMSPRGHMSSRRVSSEAAGRGLFSRFAAWFPGGATGRTLCRMSPQETTQAALELLEQWIERHGVPAAVYVDRKNIYRSDREASAEEKRAGTGALTDFGRARRQLGIEVIFARSPEAKGRVERKNGVLQDRLVKKLRRRGISAIDETNAMLDDFTRRLDERFGRAPASRIDRHRRSYERSAGSPCFQPRTCRRA